MTKLVPRIFPTLPTKHHGNDEEMKGYFLHALVAALEAAVPWIVRHHIESNAVPRRTSRQEELPTPFSDPAAANAAGAAAAVGAAAAPD